MSGGDGHEKGTDEHLEVKGTASFRAAGMGSAEHLVGMESVDRPASASACFRAGETGVVLLERGTCPCRAGKETGAAPLGMGTDGGLREKANVYIPVYGGTVIGSGLRMASGDAGEDHAKWTGFNWFR